jgi:protein-L-isoaspartate(D-aspartate) O-methyltransferase
MDRSVAEFGDHGKFMMAENFAAARRSMVLSQLRPNNVTSPSVIDAMGAVPREEFVPKELRGVAYLDEDLPLGEDRFLVEPRVFGRMLQAARISETDVVLDVACATGYTSAVIGQLAQAVVAIEDRPAQVAHASEILSRLEIDNVAVVEGALAAGNARQGPYNVIHINGAVEEVPHSLLEQLAPDGRLICVIGSGPGVATLYRRVGKEFHARSLFDASVPLLDSMVNRDGFHF